MFFAAPAALMARFLTSSATTANPAPASPALAASTAALSARRLVWKAISSMVLIILDVSALALEMSAIDSVSRDMDWFAFATTCLVSAMRAFAWIAWSAFCRVIEDISSSEEEVSSMDAACCDAPSASCWLDCEICPEAAATCSAPAQSPDITLANGRVMARVIRKESRRPKVMASSEPATIRVLSRAILSCICLSCSSHVVWQIF